MKMKDIVNLLEIERKRLDAAIHILEIKNHLTSRNRRLRWFRLIHHR
jgi:hypothetical protein